jgi:tight adherence protein C
MTEVVVLAVLIALGTLGIIAGLRPSTPSLDAAWSSWQGPVRDRATVDHGGGTVHAGALGYARSAPVRLGSQAALRATSGRWAADPRVQWLLRALAVTETEPSLFATRMIVVAAVLGFGPIVLWLASALVGVWLPLVGVLVVALLGPPLAVALSVSSLGRRADERRRHVRVVVGSFVDLVVLSLAGGVGIDGALYAASQVTPDWAAQRLSRALTTARERGIAPWSALAEVGEALGVPELVELSSTLQLAGTEGARVRESLTARGASMRRHEQADAESAANAMTERLFLPGALLLLGFLIFIGYPAVHRILGGF